MDLLKDEDQNYSYEITLPQLYLNLKNDAILMKTSTITNITNIKKDLC